MGEDCKVKMIVPLLLLFLDPLRSGLGVTEVLGPNRFESFCQFELNIDHDWSEATRTIDTNMLGSTHVTFLDENTLVVSFLHTTPATVRSPVPIPGQAPLVVKALFIDISTCKVRDTREWPATRRTRSRIMPIHDGGFLVQAGDVLMTYSLDLNKKADRFLPELRDGTYSRQFDVGPGGRLGFMTLRKGSDATDIWFDVDTLQTISDSATHGPGGHGPISVSAKGLLSPRFSSVDQPWNPFAWIQETGKEWKPLCTNLIPDPTDRLHFFVHTEFLADDQFLLVDTRRFSVVDRKCHILIGGDVHWTGPYSVEVEKSLSGRRFAIQQLSHWGIRVPFTRPNFNQHLHVKVYDVDSKREVFDVDFGSHDTRQIGLALSPQGSRLAVLAESSIKVYQLPLQ